jgi:hypothetical protein
MSNASGRAVDGLATDAAGVAFDVTDVAHARDFWLNGVQTAPGDGSHNFWGPNPTAQTHDAYLIYTYRDESTGNTYVRRSPGLVTHTAQRNLLPSIDLPVTASYDARILSYLGVSRADFRGVMTMQNWLDLYQPAGNFWILDADGWFYWNGFVPAGAATSLLLDAIYLPNRGNDSWQHVIEVEADFFGAASLDDVVGMSANAALIFYGLQTSPQPTLPVAWTVATLVEYLVDEAVMTDDTIVDFADLVNYLVTEGIISVSPADLAALVTYLYDEGLISSRTAV